MSAILNLELAGISLFQWFGLLVSLLSLWAAFAAFLRAGTATTAAVKAEQAAIQGIATFDAVAEIQGMIGALRSIRTLVANGAWNECANLCNECNVAASRLESQQGLKLTHDQLQKIESIKVSSQTLEEIFHDAFADDKALSDFPFKETQRALTDMMSDCSMLGNSVRSLSNEK